MLDKVGQLRSVAGNFEMVAALFQCQQVRQCNQVQYSLLPLLYSPSIRNRKRLFMIGFSTFVQNGNRIHELANIVQARRQKASEAPTDCFAHTNKLAYDRLVVGQKLVIMVLIRMGKSDDAYVAILIKAHERNRPIRSPRPVRNEDFCFDGRVSGQKAANCIDAGTPCQSITINNVASVVRLECGAVWPRTVTNQFRWMVFLVQSF